MRLLPLPRGRRGAWRTPPSWRRLCVPAPRGAAVPRPSSAPPPGSLPPPAVPRPSDPGWSDWPVLRHRPELTVTFYPVADGVAVQVQADDHVIVGHDHGCGVRIAILSGAFGVEKRAREAEHQPTRAPVR